MIDDVRATAVWEPETLIQPETLIKTVSLALSEAPKDPFEHLRL